MSEFSGKVSSAHSKPQDEVIEELEESLYLEAKKADRRLRLLDDAPLPPGRFTKTHALDEWFERYDEWYVRKNDSP